MTKSKKTNKFCKKKNPTRQKRRQTNRTIIFSLDEPFCVWAARTMWRWSQSRLSGGRGEGQDISACGCPSALQDDTLGESCPGDQSFVLGRVISNFLSKFTMYIGQEEVSIFPLGPFRVFSPCFRTPLYTLTISSTNTKTISVGRRSCHQIAQQDSADYTQTNHLLHATLTCIQEKTKLNDLQCLREAIHHTREGVQCLPGWLVPRGERGWLQLRGL